MYKQIVAFRMAYTYERRQYQKHYTNRVSSINVLSRKLNIFSRISTFSKVTYMMMMTMMMIMIVDDDNDDD